MDFLCFGGIPIYYFSGDLKYENRSSIYSYKADYSYSEIGNKALQRVSSKIGLNKIKTFKKDGIFEKGIQTRNVKFK